MRNKTIKLDADSWDDVFQQAMNISNQYPEMYVTVYQDFGQAFAKLSKRLHVFAPSDCSWDAPEKCYWKAGKKKQFTDKQKIADQNSTPALH